MNKDVIKFATKAFLAVTAIVAGKKLRENAIKDAKRIGTGNNNKQKVIRPCYEDLSPRNALIAAMSSKPLISRTMPQYCQCRSDAGVAAILSGQVRCHLLLRIP